jgi:cell division transport system permease protein
VRLAVREAIRSFGRAPVLSVLSVTTIAFALFVVGLVVLVGINVRAALEQVGERVEIVVYLRRGTPLEAATVAMEDILAFPEVADVGYVSEEEALRRARAQLEEFRDVFDDLAQNPLPASIEVRLLPEFRDAASAAAVAERLGGFRFAEDVRYGRDWIAKLDRLRSIAAAVSFLISAAFAAASVIIIGTTIRLTVLQRSREIAIMRFVGATDWFVRLPFLLEGAFKGAMGGVLALGLSYGAFLVVNRLVLEGRFFAPGEALGFVLAGTLLGLLSSAVSVGRHLREV